MKNRASILINAKLKRTGVTIFTRSGQTVVRSAGSVQPKRRTKQQFDVRQRRAYVTTVWRYIKGVCGPLFSGDRHPYYLYCALAAKLPVLYLTEPEHACGSAPLLPGTPVSCGTLPDIGCRLATVAGVPALLTDLRRDSLGDDTLLLVTLRQWYDHGTPRLLARQDPVEAATMEEVAGCLALTGACYGDPSCGWALVRCNGRRRSTQCLVSESDTWRDYTTAAARKRAAASYGGLTY